LTLILDQFASSKPVLSELLDLAMGTHWVKLSVSAMLAERNLT
jgi:hypothetical protein